MIPFVHPHQFVARGMRDAPVHHHLRETVSAIDYRLGFPGQCSRKPGLDMFIPDDSASVTVPGGSDPIASRYSEVKAAVIKVGQWCHCKQCIAAIIHFDTPTSGDVPPTVIKGRRGQALLKHGLIVPSDASGASVLGPSLTRAEEMASEYPSHDVRLTILTDWQLFDSDLRDLPNRLHRFPGHVLCVGLGWSPPVELKADNTSLATIAYKDPLGTVARAVFNQITRDRVRRRVLPPHGMRSQP